MEDKLINFETAQLAKEKGFKKKTFYYYYYYKDNKDNRELYPEKIGTSELRANSVSGISSKTAADAGFGGCHTGDYLHYRVVLKELLIDVNKYPAKNVMFQAPTQSLLQKWLREKHEIIVWAEPFNSPHICYEPQVLSDKIEEDWETDDIEDTYEEALEIALQNGLKLIKT